MHPSTPYALAFLSEYAQTLDALPLELSRNFADLRELDAVLSSAMAALNVKILNLIEMVESKEVSKEKRYWLLREIADEATKLKLGGDDKIRVACQAADSLHAHSAHLTALLNQIPGLDPSIFIRKTAYPHVSPHAYSINAPYESSRRRRAANGSGLLVGSTDPSPSKKRKIVQDGDFEFVNGRSPRKEKTGESSSQARVNRGGGQRSRKYVYCSKLTFEYLNYNMLAETIAAGLHPSLCFQFQWHRIYRYKMVPPFQIPVPVPTITSAATTQITNVDNKLHKISPLQDLQIRIYH